MRSSRPKPLHHLCGRPMVLYVLDAAAEEDVRAVVVVVGHGATWVEKSVRESAEPGVSLTFVEQAEQLGTGHAVSVALPAVVRRDRRRRRRRPHPSRRHAACCARARCARCSNRHREGQAALTVLSAEVDDPTGYGRVVRAKDGTVARIVEERDASDDERDIREVNTAIMVVRDSVLGPALRRVGRHNAQNEYYLTDLVAELHDAGHVTDAMLIGDPTEAAGVNDRAQLAAAEAVLRQRINDRWMQRGVTMWDPAHTYVDADVVLAAEVVLLPGTVLKGRCVVERGAQIGPNAVLVDSTVGEGAVVGVVDATLARIGATPASGPSSSSRPAPWSEPGAVIAPFTHLTP